jgi:hypothetical protein
MGNTTIQITLSADGGKSGPLYDAYYSTDCGTYFALTGSTNLYLPNLGSTVNVTIPDITSCIKLVNLSPGCNDNFIIKNLNFNTTTTTTFGPTTTTTTPAPPCIPIGTSYGGGIVFAVQSDMVYISSMADLTSSTGGTNDIKWGCQGTYIAGATNDTWGGGYSSSLAIEAGCVQTNVAAKFALSASINGYDDWYLPNSTELLEMYSQRNVIGGFVTASYSGNFPYYWSSINTTADYGDMVNFNGGGLSNVNTKGNNYRARAIRSVSCSSITTTTTTIAPTTTTTTLSGNCHLYTFSNFSDYGDYVNYVACGTSIETSVFVTDGTAPQYCVQDGFIPYTYNPGITITEGDSC